MNGQSRPTATIRLTAPAPAGNAPIILESSQPDVATVPANVSVAAGETTNTFAIDTSTVRSPTAVTISARYEGVTVTAVLDGAASAARAAIPRRIRLAWQTTPAPSRHAAGAAGLPVRRQPDHLGSIAVYRWTLSVGGKELALTQARGIRRRSRP